MRAKVLKSDKYKRAVREGTLSEEKLVVVPRVDYTLDEELYYWADSMPNSTKEVERSLYEEIVEGFDALGLTEEDKQLLDRLDAEEFSFEVMQKRWEHQLNAPIKDNEAIQKLLNTKAPWENS